MNVYVLFILFTMGNGHISWLERAERYAAEECRERAHALVEQGKSEMAILLFRHTPFAKMDVICMPEPSYEEFERRMEEQEQEQKGRRPA